MFEDYPMILGSVFALDGKLLLWSAFDYPKTFRTRLSERGSAFRREQKVAPRRTFSACAKLTVAVAVFKTADAVFWMASRVGNGLACRDAENIICMQGRVWT